MIFSFNALVAKLVSGKRINFSQRNAYAMRCTAASIQYNTKRLAYVLHKKIAGRSPSIRFKRLQQNRMQKRLGRARRRCFVDKGRKSVVAADSNYGPDAETPDLEASSPEEYENRVTEFFHSVLRLSAEQRTELERSTVGQSTSSLWLVARRCRLTASNFSVPCKMRATTSTANAVKRILYGVNVRSKAIAWGKEHEDIAFQQLAEKMNKVIRKCGFYVHEEFPFLGKF